MRGVKRFFRTVGEKVKKVLTHKSKGYNDIVKIASVIILTVIVVVIAEYLLAPLFDALNCEYLKYPVLVLVAISIIVSAIILLLRDFGVAE